MLLDFTKSCYSTETKRRVARERRKKIMQKILNRKKSSKNNLYGSKDLGREMTEGIVNCVLRVTVRCGRL